MSPAIACQSRPLVESMFDGRLERADKASVERHLLGCASCAAWLRDLERVRSEARRDPSPAPTPLELARGRLALLRRAAAEPVRSERDPRWIAAVLVAAAVAVVSAWLVWPKPARPLEAIRFAPAVPLEAKVTMLASDGAELGTQIARDGGEGSAARSADGRFGLHLVDGTVSLWVRKLGPRQRVVVETRDAEVEVRGTIFRVTAEHGELVAVDVDDGVVEVRRGDERRFVRAGDKLDLRAPAAEAEPPTPEATPAAGEPRAARAAEAPAAPPPATTPPVMTPPAAVAPVPDKAGASGVVASAAEKPRPAAPKRDPAADDFAGAVGELDHADYPSAAARLSDFVKQHPNDARAEDAAFLAVVALQKTGRRSEMLAAARDYLRRFPNGARAGEVRRWVAAP